MRHGQEGEPGERGEAGTRGGGEGGRGGKGGRGGSVPRWRATTGYVFIISVAVLAVFFHSERDSSRIHRVQRQDCEFVNIVAENQKFVLEALVPLTRATQHAASATLRRQARKTLPRLEEALRRAGPRQCP